jgi:uncharacterized protein (DUF1501 family)
MTLTRRALLAAAAAAALAPRALSRGRSASARHLVLVTAYGGWDASYAIDPKPRQHIDGPWLDEDRSDPTDVERVETIHGLPLQLNDGRRPNLRALFERWGPSTLILNGVHTGSIAHESCRLRMLTGTLNGAAADLAAISAAARPEAPVPYMDLGGLGLVGPLAAQSGRAGRSNQLGQLLDRRRPVTRPDGLRYPLFHADDAEAADIDAFLAAAWARQPAWGRGADRVADGPNARARAATLLTDGAVFADGLTRAATRTLRQQADLAVELLTSGLASSVSLDSGLLWDTHTDNAQQHAAWNDLASGLDYLFTALDDAELLDDTVVLVLSDMNRTPRRNADQGKDHWPVTSALLLGAGVTGGRVLGATDDRSDAVAVDLATGLPDPAGVVPRYDHLAAGVLQLVGVDPDAWLPGVTPLGGLS